MQLVVYAFSAITFSNVSCDGNSGTSELWAKSKKLILWEYGTNPIGKKHKFMRFLPCYNFFETLCHKTY